MTDREAMKPNDRPVLSICIPTYNRADCLDNCLDSLERATRNCRDQIDIVVSDNASTDHTPDVVNAWKALLPIRYVRNAVNIGGERNFFSSASHASAEYIWIFGDDDDFGESAVTEVLRYIKQGYDVILSNYSSWSKDMNQMIGSNGMSPSYKPEYDDRELILSTFGILMGYISSVVVRKSILLSTPPSEYEIFVPYGFPFPFCVYCGMQKGARLAFIPTPLFRRRQYNSDFDGTGSGPQWLKFFTEGPALVFEALEQKGYSRAAIRRAQRLDEDKPTQPEQVVAYGTILNRLGRTEESIPRLTAASRELHASGSGARALQADYQLARAFMLTGRYDESLSLLAEVERAWNANATANKDRLADLARTRAEIELARRRVDEARKLIDGSLAQFGYPSATSALGLTAALTAAARIYLAQNQLAPAESFASAALRIAEGVARDPAQSADVGEAALVLAALQRAKSDTAAARTNTKRAIEALTNGLGGDHVITREATALQAALQD